MAILRRRTTHADRTPSNIGGQFRPEIEGLRSVAVILVVLDHVFAQPEGGFVGVDVFFVISGYLITGLLLREFDRSGRISIKDFYRRRARRILPGAIVVLLACLLFSRLWFFANRAHDTLIDILWAGGFAANIHFAAVGTDYFNADRAPSPVQHFWSLAVEEQFYLVWPLALLVLLWVARRCYRRAPHLPVLVITTFGVAALFYWSLQLTAQNRTTAYFSTPARAWELGIGAVLALAAPYLSRLPRGIGVAAIGVGLGLVIVSAFVVRDNQAFPTPWAAGPCGGTALIIVGGFVANTSRIALPLTNLASRYIGRISYSLYLWHWPVLIFLATRLNGSTAYLRVTELFTMFGISVASYHFVETPVRTLRWRQLRQSVAEARHARGSHYTHSGRRAKLQERYAAGYAAILLIGLAAAVWTIRPMSSPPTFIPAGFGVDATAPTATNPGPADDTGPAGPTATTAARPYGEVAAPAALSSSIVHALQATKFPDLKPGLGDLSNAKASQWTTCGNVGPQQLAACTYPPTGSITREKKVVVIGDSFAISWLPALMDLRSDGYTVYALTYGQCPAAEVTVNQQVGAASGFGAACDAHRNWAVSEVADLKPDIVVLASLDNTVERLASRAKGAAALTEWGKGTAQIITRLQAAGAKRVVTLASPPPAGNLATCAPNASADPANCVTAVNAEWHQVADIERTQVQATKSTYLDSRLLFCASNDYCPSFIGTTPVRVDGSHLTDAYSTSLGPILSPLIIGP